MEAAMTTRFADPVNQGVAIAETLAAEARKAIAEHSPELDAQLARAMRRARRGAERAADVRDGTRLAIKRHPFRAVALMFGAGALVGLAIGRFTRTRPSPAAPPQPAGEYDIEC
jgi:ElaB/YqjD/DUF883 family membrane-anchored ribosome-binding protein